MSGAGGDAHGRRPRRSTRRLAYARWARLLVGATATVSQVPRAALADTATSAAAPAPPNSRFSTIGTTPEGPGARGERLQAFFYGGLGMLALPAAAICSNPSAPCRSGETSVALSLASLVRWGRFAAGAGADVAFGLRPEDGARAEGREHAQSYFSFHALARWMFPVTSRLEWWLGGSVGAAVLGDTWSTPADRHPASDIQTLGPQRLTLGTEGLSLGASLGAQWRFGDRFLVGSELRYLNWVFPSERARTPFDDTASLAGRVDVFEFGALVGFRTGL